MSLLDQYEKRVPKEKRHLATIAYLASLEHIRSTCPLVAEKIVQELKDQRSHLKLIASENFSSYAVQLAMGNWMTDKYAEGVPFRRFYAGCDNVDAIEDLAVCEAKKIFSAAHAYVQPHSGADANLVAFWSLLVYRVQNKELERLGKKTLESLTPEEYESIRKLLVNQKVMGMSLHSGGHLTHGYRHNISSKMMQSVSYDVDPKTGLLDLADLQRRVKEEKPAILIAGYSAYPRKINFAKMREIADSVGALFMVDMAHFAGLVAGKVMEGEYNPIPYAHIVTTTTHKTLRGPRGGMVLCAPELKEIVDKGCPLVLGGPLPHVLAAKAIAFQEASSPSFQSYAHQIVRNAHALAQGMIEEGFPVTTGGTENHLLVFDVASPLKLTGKQAEDGLRQAGMTVNRNSLPGDQNGAWFTSGVRIGTPALTTLGMKEKEMREIAKMISTVLRACKPIKEGDSLSRTQVEVREKERMEVRAQVQDLLHRFPLYPEIVLE